jgi:OPT family oligopeptide transporter
MMLGGMLSLTNLYVGAKTGWTLGVGITSVILAFALFKVMSKIGLASEFTVLENNAMQSIATAAGYMTSPMISSLAAYMMVAMDTHPATAVIPLWQTLTWISALAILGVLFAFPFKRRFINDEQQPFPEGRAAGIVMDSLHHGEAESSMLKAKLLVICSVGSALVKVLQNEAIFKWIHDKLGDNPIARFVHPLPEMLDDWLYKIIPEPKILGTSVKSLTIRPELDLAMIGAGGLMGMRTTISLLLGAAINYAFIAPIMIQEGDIVPNPRTGMIGFREITFWSLWGGVAMMTSASLLSFFAKPQVLISAFRNLFGGRRDSSDALADIELPLTVSIVGIPLLGLLVVYMGHVYFGIEWWLGIIALVLVFFFCLIAINSTGLTSITPIGAMGKLTQLTFGILAPRNIGTNLMTAGITGEVASHSANLLMDIKPGYMLGAKPRQQAMGHVLGVIAGAVFSVPIFYLVFLQLNPDQIFAPGSPGEYRLDADKYPMPSATVWKAVAEVLTTGIENIKYSARIAVLVGILLGLLLEGGRLATKGRLPLSPVALGLGFLIQFHTCLAMFLGAFFFWLVEKIWVDRESRMNRVVAQNQEPICAGLIAGGSLMAIALAALEVFVLSKK